LKAVVVHGKMEEGLRVGPPERGPIFCGTNGMADRKLDGKAVGKPELGREVR
jgi:hypothetical protein